MKELVADNVGALEDVAATLISVACERFPREHAVTIALKGELGAGKTALTKAMARYLGIEGHVTSPTFIVMKSYPIPHHEHFTTLTHVDAYRIDDERELTVIGFDELVNDPHRLIIIEWPERVPGHIPSDTFHVAVEAKEDEKRIFTYER